MGASHLGVGYVSTRICSHWPYFTDCFVPSPRDIPGLCTLSRREYRSVNELDVSLQPKTLKRSSDKLTYFRFNFVIGLTTKDMLGSMKYGTYIFFAFFSGCGGLFIWWFVPETKNKTLEELDVYFGGSQDSLATKDKERMQNIQERLGLAGIESVDDVEKKDVYDERVEAKME